MDKILKFFQNKVVMIVEAVLLIASSAGLIIGGVSVESITGLVKLVLAAIAAIDGVITAVAALIGFKKNAAKN